MGKSGARSGTRSDGEATRLRILEAAIDTLCTEGFSGTSARSIAAKGGFNQALVFYHFGSVNELLLAALGHVGTKRMDDYSAALGSVGSLGDLVVTARSILDQDLDRGYVKVLSEMISGASTYPELGPRIWQEIRPWVDFTDQAITRVLAGSALAAVVPTSDVAHGIVALYLGLELLAQLNGERGSIDNLFGSVAQLAGLIAALPRAAPRTIGGNN